MTGPALAVFAAGLLDGQMLPVAGAAVASRAPA